MNVGISHVALRTGIICLGKERRQIVNLLAANKRLKKCYLFQNGSQIGGLFFLWSIFFYLETLCNTSIEYTGCTITSLPPAYSIVSRESSSCLTCVTTEKRHVARVKGEYMYVGCRSRSVFLFVCPMYTQKLCGGGLAGAPPVARGY